MICIIFAPLRAHLAQRQLSAIVLWPKSAAIDAKTCEQVEDDAELDSSQDWKGSVRKPRRRTFKKRSGLVTKAVTRELVRNTAGSRSTPCQPDPTVVANLVAAASAVGSSPQAAQEDDGAATLTASRESGTYLDTGAGVYKWLWKEEDQLEDTTPTAAAGRSAATRTEAPRNTAKPSGSEERKTTGSCRPERSTGGYTKKSTASAVASLLGNVYESRAGGTARVTK